MISYSAQSATTLKLVPTTDQNTTIATSTAITGLSASVGANSIYEVHGFVHIGCNNTGGVKFDITIPSGATIFVNCNGRSNTGTAVTMSSITTSATLTTNALNTFSNQNGMAFFRGTITTGATAGTMVIGFASGTATETSTVYKEGSVIEFTKIG